MFMIVAMFYSFFMLNFLRGCYGWYEENLVVRGVDFELANNELIFSGSSYKWENFTQGQLIFVRELHRERLRQTVRSILGACVAIPQVHEAHCTTFRSMYAFFFFLTYCICETTHRTERTCAYHMRFRQRSRKIELYNFTIN